MLVFDVTMSLLVVAMSAALAFWYAGSDEAVMPADSSVAPPGWERVDVRLWEELRQRQQGLQTARSR
jgi:hypothetical protein